MIPPEEIKQLKDTLGTLTRYSEDDLVSRPGWGDVTFEDSRGYIRHVLSIAADLESMPLDLLRMSVFSTIRSAVEQVVSQLDRIDGFTITSGDVSGNRQDIVNELRSAAEELYEQAGPWIPYLAYKRGDTTENMQQINDAIKEAETMLGDAEMWVTNKKADIDRIVEKTREAAADAGVTTFTEQFGTETETLNKRSNKWLGATGVFAALTIGAGVLFYFWPEVGTNADGWDTLRNIVSKGTIIAVLFTGTVWCGRIYRALIHQAAVNRHRELSLQTFQAFVEATSDPHVKDAVLMAATKTIFANVPTGLVKSGGGNPEGGVQFVELGKGAAKAVVEPAVD